MQERKVILTWEAIYDVAEIVDYIEQNFSFERAERFEDDIYKQLNNLGYMGGIYGNTAIYYRSYAIFKKPFPPSILLKN